MNRTLQQQVLPQKLNPLLLFAKGVHAIPLTVIYIILTKNTIPLKSDNLNISKEILVYNVLSSRVAEYNNINLDTFTINNFVTIIRVYFFKADLNNEETVMKRIVY